MNDRSPGDSGLVVLLAACVCFGACGGDSSKSSAASNAAPTKTMPSDPATKAASETKVPGEGDGAGAPASDAEGDDAEADGDDAAQDDGTDETEDADGDNAAEADGDDAAGEDADGQDVDEKETAGGEGADEGEGDDDGDESASADPKALLKEVRSKRTPDARARKALEEAEAAGASARQLARAAKDRGDALFATPERAAEFYEWSADKDPAYPVASFALAKQAVTKGDIDETKKHLEEVHERGGKKLLQQIEFDPMWEIVKDDPDVRTWVR